MKWSSKNVIVCGLGDKKEETEESLVEEMVKIAEKLQVNLDEREIPAIHRLPSKKKTSSHPIIVELTTTREKFQLLKMSKERRIKGIYINDHLTRNSQLILDEARALRDKGYFQFA